MLSYDHDIGRQGSRRCSRRAEASFLRLITTGELEVADLGIGDYERCVDLIECYENLGLGLVDASIVTIAENLAVTTIATLNDRDWLTPRAGRVGLESVEARSRRRLRHTAGWVALAIGVVITVVLLERRFDPPAPSLSRRDREALGAPIDRFLEGVNSDPNSSQVCAEDLVERRQVGDEVHVAARAMCEIVQRREGWVDSGWSTPVLIKGRMTGDGYQPFSVEQPGDGDAYGRDIRRMFSRAAAAVMLRNPGDGLASQLQGEIRAVR